jgi:hypothetical protein
MLLRLLDSVKQQGYELVIINCEHYMKMGGQLNYLWMQIF